MIDAFFVKHYIEIIFNLYIFGLLIYFKKKNLNIMVGIAYILINPPADGGWSSERPNRNSIRYKIRYKYLKIKSKIIDLLLDNRNVIDVTLILIFNTVLKHTESNLLIYLSSVIAYTGYLHFINITCKQMYMKKIALNIKYEIAKHPELLNDVVSIKKYFNKGNAL